MSISRFNKALGMGRSVKAFLNSEKNIFRVAKRWAERAKQKKRLERKKREASRLKDELRAVKRWTETSEQRKRLIQKKQEILQLTNELRAAEEQRAGSAPYSRSALQATGESETGALPDFLIIGGKKCGTTSLYHLLTYHPYVERAAAKELHFFNSLFEEGIEWYRRCFPPPRWRDGRRTITGEATPCLSHPLAPERMAEVVPQARLIALLRNPVDRTYSDYHHRIRLGRETRTFEEAIEAEQTWLLSKEDKTSEHRHSAGHEFYKYLTGSIYVDHLLRWSRFFAEEQMLVLKSEDFYEHPRETLKFVLNFLDLPDWEPETWEIRNRNKGPYEQQMNPATRRRLEDFFEPHNQRLYEYLGVDFGW